MYMKQITNPYCALYWKIEGTPHITSFVLVRTWDWKKGFKFLSESCNAD